MDTDAIRRQLADVAEKLLELPDDAFEERFQLRQRQDELRARARERLAATGDRPAFRVRLLDDGGGVIADRPVSHRLPRGELFHARPTQALEPLQNRRPQVKEIWAFRRIHRIMGLPFLADRPEYTEGRWG